MASDAINSHGKWFLRCSLWLVSMAVCTAVVDLYAGARWAALTPVPWLAVFFPVVLMPIIKSSPKD